MVLESRAPRGREVWSPRPCAVRTPLPPGPASALRGPQQRGPLLQAHAGLRLPGADGLSSRPPGARGGDERGAGAGPAALLYVGGAPGRASTAGREPAALTVGRVAEKWGQCSCERRARHRLRGGFGCATARSCQSRQHSAGAAAAGAGGGAGSARPAPPRRSGLASAPPPPPLSPTTAPPPQGAPGEDPRDPRALPGTPSPKGRGSGLSVNPQVGAAREQDLLCVRTPSWGPQGSQSRRNGTRYARVRSADFSGKPAQSSPKSPYQPRAVPNTNMERTLVWGLLHRGPNRFSQKGQSAPGARGCCRHQPGMPTTILITCWGDRTPWPILGRLLGCPSGWNRRHALDPL